MTKATLVKSVTTLVVAGAAALYLNGIEVKVPESSQIQIEDGNVSISTPTSGESSGNTITINRPGSAAAQKPGYMSEGDPVKPSDSRPTRPSGDIVPAQTVGSSASMPGKPPTVARDPEEAKRAITELYKTILGRPPEPDGFKFWMEKAAQGMSNETMRNAFARSTESRRNVEELYQLMFGRPADEEGLNYWLNDMAAKGQSLADVRWNMANSGEAQSLIRDLYGQYLRRPPEDKGMADWLEVLRTKGLDAVHRGIAESVEAKARAEELAARLAQSSASAQRATASAEKATTAAAAAGRVD